MDADTESVFCALRVVELDVLLEVVFPVAVSTLLLALTGAAAAVGAALGVCRRAWAQSERGDSAGWIVCAALPYSAALLQSQLRRRSAGLGVRLLWHSRLSLPDLGCAGWKAGSPHRQLLASGRHVGPWYAAAAGRPHSLFQWDGWGPTVVVALHTFLCGMTLTTMLLLSVLPSLPLAAWTNTSWWPLPLHRHGCDCPVVDGSERL